MADRERGPKSFMKELRVKFWFKMAKKATSSKREAKLRVRRSNVNFANVDNYFKNGKILICGEAKQ